MCDCRTIISPDDYLYYNFVDDYETESYYLNYVNNDFHEWYYYPNMHKNECILFIQYDSYVKSKARHTFHTSIKDPNCNDKKFVRESIETRLIAFFDDFKPNTIKERKKYSKNNKKWW